MYPGNNYDGLVGGGGALTGVNQFTYTAQFGNGVSGTISVQDPTQYFQAGILNFGPNTTGTTPTGQFIVGTHGLGVSDIAGTTARISSATSKLHTPGVWPNCRQQRMTTTPPTTAMALVAHKVLRQTASRTAPLAAEPITFRRDIPTTSGDLPFRVRSRSTTSRPMLATRSTPAASTPRYNIQDLASQAGAWSSFAGGSSVAGALGKYGIGVAPDAVFNVGGQEQLISTWGMRGAFNHNWDPYWSTSIYGGWAFVDYGAGARNVFCTSFVAANPFVTTCNPNYSVAQLGTVTRWTPVNFAAKREDVYSLNERTQTLTFSTQKVTDFLASFFRRMTAEPS
jgi:hypothetical protein